MARKAPSAETCRFQPQVEEEEEEEEAVMGRWLRRGPTTTCQRPGIRGPCDESPAIRASAVAEHATVDPQDTGHDPSRPVAPITAAAVG